MQEIWFDPWVGKIPWRRAWQPTPVFLPGPCGQSLAGYSPWGCRVRPDWATFTSGIWKEGILFHLHLTDEKLRPREVSVWWGSWLMAGVNVCGVNRRVNKLGTSTKYVQPRVPCTQGLAPRKPLIRGPECLLWTRHSQEPRPRGGEGHKFPFPEALTVSEVKAVLANN